MIIGSDPQLTWWREGADESCKSDDCVADKARTTNEAFVAAMNNITSLGNWPTAGLDKAAGAPVTSPSGVILNGDLTAFWHKWQKEMYEDLYDDLNFQVYPGLGNHDYDNNVGDCDYAALYYPDHNRCAKEAVWWMANQIRGLPNVVNNDVPGFIGVESAGSFAVRFTVEYTLNGSRQSQSSGAYPSPEWRTVTIPPAATNITLNIEGLTGWEVKWRSLYETTMSSPRPVCFRTDRSHLDPRVRQSSCGGTAFPNGASGSLAYSYDLGNYHFVQLQNWPGYTESLPAVETIEDYLTFGLRNSPGFNITPSYTWLTSDLRNATAAGKNIIINMHDDQYSPAAFDNWNDPSFRTAIRDQNVVGIFAGHIHQDAGRIGTMSNGLRSDIPVYRSGSAECGTFLYADFHDRFYNISVVDASDGTPSFLNDSTWTCDDQTFGSINYNHNSGSQGLIGTYDFNHRPEISSAYASPRFADEGTSVPFYATASDQDGDTLTYSWDFGDGQTGTGATPTHTYAEDGEYTARVTVADGYGGTHSADVKVEIDNVAPTLTATVEDVDENGVATISGTISDPGTEDTFSVTIDWGEGDAQTYDYVAGTTEFSETHRYLDDDPTATPEDEYPVSIKLADDDGGSAEVSDAITVANVAPKLSATGATIDENGTATVEGTITDPGTKDSFELTIDWGEGDPVTYSYGAGTTTFAEKHQYLDDNPTGTATDDYAIAVSITDDDGGTATASTTTTVGNVAPTLTANGATIDENGTATVEGTITDPGTKDSFELTIDWGEGDPVTYSYAAGTTTFAEQHQYLDDNPTGTATDEYQVLLSLVDDDTGAGEAETTVTVENVAPVATIDSVTNELGAVVGADAPVVLVDQPISLAASHTDVGTRDTHTGSIDWGDGSSTDLGSVSGPESATHRFAAPGTYTVTLAVVDDDTGRGTDSWTVEVVGASGAGETVVDMLRAIADAPGTDAAASDAIDKAIGFLIGNDGGAANNGALDSLSRDDPGNALGKLQLVLDHLADARAADPDLDLRPAEQLIGLMAKSIATDSVHAAAETTTKRAEERKLAEAEQLLADANDELAAGHVRAAVDDYRKAVRQIQALN